MNAEEQTLWDNVVQRLLGTSTNEPREAAAVANAIIDARRAYFATSAHTPPRVEGESPKAFDDGLVERLVEIVFAVESNDARDVVRAILTELAATSVEMPTAEQIRAAWYETVGTRSEIAGASGVAEMLRARLAPILAAKDAEIAKLGAPITDPTKPTKPATNEFFAQLPPLDTTGPCQFCGGKGSVTIVAGGGAFGFAQYQCQECNGTGMTP